MDGFILLCCISVVFLGLMYHAHRKFLAIKSAEMIVKRQYEPLEKYVIDDGFSFYEGDELKRYTTIVRRIRQQYGHDGFKVGHMAWLLDLMDKPQIDVNSVDIPAFEPPGNK